MPEGKSAGLRELPTMPGETMPDGDGDLSGSGCRGEGYRARMRRGVLNNLPCFFSGAADPKHIHAARRSVIYTN